MDKDWRLTNQMNYLHHAILQRASFDKDSTDDHQHCEFCFDKFGNETGLLKTGYCTLDKYRWICDDCFLDFQKQFGWQVVNNR